VAQFRPLPSAHIVPQALWLAREMFFMQLWSQFTSLLVGFRKNCWSLWAGVAQVELIQQCARICCLVGFLLINYLRRTGSTIHGFCYSISKWISLDLYSVLACCLPQARKKLILIVNLQKHRQNNQVMYCLPLFQNGYWRQITMVYKIFDMVCYWLLLSCLQSE
jgi:hypothetical protein